ncbi:MAG: hypothetical protein PVI90_06205, partial [Desulfobacteraceae bacterium]
MRRDKQDGVVIISATLKASKWCYQLILNDLCRINTDKEYSKNEETMYIYWRVQQDLNELGNILIFHNPSLVRQYKQWVKKNAAGIALAEGLTWD